MKTIARKRSKVKKKATRKKAASKKTSRPITKKVAKKSAKKAARKVATIRKPTKKKVVKKKVVKKTAVKRVIKRAKVVKKTKGTRRASDITRPKKKKKAVRKTVRRKAVKRESSLKDLDTIDRLTELVRQQLASKVSTTKIPRAAKKGKRKIVEKKGPLRDRVERMLSRPMAEAQMIERMEDKLPRGFFQDGEKWVETEESIIIQRLAMAEQLGVFDEEARENALEFDWDLRDVYELWHSPDVYF